MDESEVIFDVVFVGGGCGAAAAAVALSTAFDVGLRVKV
jgi:NifU-like protein involved in Fe-S cluster formation